MKQPEFSSSCESLGLFPTLVLGLKTFLQCPAKPFMHVVLGKDHKLQSLHELFRISRLSQPMQMNGYSEIAKVVVSTLVAFSFRETDYKRSTHQGHYSNYEQQVSEST